MVARIFFLQHSGKLSRQIRTCDFTKSVLDTIGKRIDDLAAEEESKAKCQAIVDYCKQPNTRRLLERKESRTSILSKMKLDLKSLLIAAPEGFALNNQELLKAVTGFLDGGLLSMRQAHVDKVTVLFVIFSSFLHKCQALKRFQVQPGRCIRLNLHVCTKVEISSDRGSLQPQQP